MSQLLAALGVILVLGGLGHSIGVLQFYVTQGVPGVNQVLIDVWVAQAHLLGGGLYLAAFRAMRSGSAWRALSVFGALTILVYAVSCIPVLFLRAPMKLRIPPIVYLLLSVFILTRTARAGTPDRRRL